MSNDTYSRIIKSMLEREEKRFPTPRLGKEFPTAKQWSYIKSLEEKTGIEFVGITRKDAIEYIDHTKHLQSK